MTNVFQQRTCDDTMKEESAKYPLLADGDDQTSSMLDGQSTAAGSGAGTPLATNGPGSTKLKLTFNSGGSRAASRVATNGTDSGIPSDEE